MPTDFVSRTLGKWSSHPEALKRQRKWFVLAAWLPVLVLLLAACFWLTDFDAWCSIAKNPVPKVKIFFAAVLAGVGFLMSMGLLNMVASTIATKRPGDAYGRDAIPFPLWLVVASCFFWLAPWGLSFLRTQLWDGPYFGVVQFVLNLLCFLPFVMIVLWSVFARERPSANSDEELVHPRFPYLLAGLFAAIAVFSLCTDVCAMVVRLCPRLNPWIGKWDDVVVRLCLLATLLPLAVICWVIGRLRWKVRKIRPRKSVPPGGDAAETSGDKVPACAKWILEHLPDGVTQDGDVVLQGVDSASPFASGVDVGTRALFGGLLPTRDQQAFFERFRKAYEECVVDFFDNNDPRDAMAGADIVLQGVDGSGRTEAMLAAGLYAALVRGQSVLYVVSDVACAKRLAEIVNRRFSAMLVDCYFNADYLTELSVPAWVDRSQPVRPPCVLFATPEKIETGFFCFDDPRKLEDVKRLLCSYNVVLVDDFLEFPLSVRSHLAFVLDKIRLVLGAEGVLPQMVVATTPLYAPEGVEALGGRLFGMGKFNRQRNVFNLLPRQCAPFWCGTLRVSRGHSLEAVSHELVKTCLDGKFATLLYRKGISKSEEDRIHSDFHDAAAGGQFKVLSHLYEFDEIDAPQDAVFYLSITCGNAGTALRLNMSDDVGGGSVFFRISKEGEGDGGNQSESRFALLPDETAMSLRALHLRSVLPMVNRLTPVAETIWSHFGITINHPCIREVKSVSEVGSQMSVKWMHDSIVEGDAYANGQVWPYLVLTARASISGRGQPVDFNSLPCNRECIWAEKHDGLSDGDRLILAKPAGDAIDSRRQLALWVTDRGERLGETDLAHADEFVLKLGEDEYSASMITPPKGEELNRYALRISAQFLRGTDEDFSVPIRRLSWNVPFGGLRVPDIRVHEALTSLRLERRGGLSFDVSGRLIGLMNLRGEEQRRIPRGYGYEAYLSCFVLIPSLSFDDDEVPDGPERYVRECLSGAWTTDAKSGYSVALTHALTASLRQKLTGFSFFAAAPVFYIAGREGSVGKVVMWMIEPTNSGQSIYPSLELLLERNHAFRSELFSLAKEILSRASGIEDLRLASRTAYADEAFTEDDRTRALRVIEQMLSRELRDEEEIPNPAHRKRTVPAKRIKQDSYTEEERAFDAVVVAGLRNFDETIDVTDFAVKYGWNVDRISDLFMDVLWNNPQIFYVSKRGRYQWWSDAEGRITRFVITDILYGIQKSQYESCWAELEKAVAEALAVVGGETDPVRKARLLHDHIVRICEYDRVAADTNDGSPLARTVYSVLVRHLAVCEGYTMAYRYLLDRVGIRAEEVISDAMNHCWNYVQIGENWYHVDVTWDDPLYAGKDPATAPIGHDYFLLSDSAVKAAKHHSWDVRGLPPATDTQYDGRNWT